MTHIRRDVFYLLHIMVKPFGEPLPITTAAFAVMQPETGAFFLGYWKCVGSSYTAQD